jgi:hypothetical protein
VNENHKNHKLMWNELARTGGNDKYNVTQRLGLPDVELDCYACESTKNKTGWKIYCGKCPICWTKKEKHQCLCKDSPFKRWDSARTPRTRKKYAKIIANMKWRTKK